MLRGNAESCRGAADAYRRSAGASEDSSLASLQFDQSSDFAAQARAFDRDAEAIDAVLKAATATPDLLAALKRSLDWLASYQGCGAEGCYEQAKAAIAKATHG
jgi:hypothetical protein